MENRFYKGKSILITGGAGFIGTNLVKRLAESCDDYTNIIATYHTKTPQYPVKNVTYVQVDLSDAEACVHIMANIDYAFLCAAHVTGAEGMLQNPLGFISESTIINLRVLEAAYRSNVKKCLFVSSGMVYPYTHEPLNETMGMDGEPYEKYYAGGWCKRFTEIVCRMYAEKLERSMPIVAVRVDNIYGPYDSFLPEKSHVVASLIRKAVARDDPFIVWGNGQDYKDFIYIDDLIDGILLALEKHQSGFDCFNLASGKNITVNDVLSVILKEAEYSDARIQYDAGKPTMIPYKVMDISKARTLLGFDPKVSLENGIRQTIRWYRNNKR